MLPDTGIGGKTMLKLMGSVMIFGAYGDNYDPAAFIYAQF